MRSHKRDDSLPFFFARKVINVYINLEIRAHLSAWNFPTEETQIGATSEMRKAHRLRFTKMRSVHITDEWN
jgi:hypothetical protein